MNPEFEQNMRKWTALDNKIRSTNAELKTLRTQREQTSLAVCNFIKSNHWENKKISMSDSTISFYEKHETTSLTFTYLEKCLGEIIPEKERVQSIIKYLKEKREVKTTNDLRRTFHNDKNNNNTSGDE
jgi:hypothetical protein